MSIPRKKKLCLDCKHPKYLFSGGRCEDCWRKEQVTTKKKTTAPRALKLPINKVSSKQAKLNQAYSVLREQFLNNSFRCEVTGCWHMATQVHHKRGRIGERMLDSTEWLAVCHACHEKIELNPEWAYKNGYSLKRLENNILK